MNSINVAKIEFILKDRKHVHSDKFDTLSHIVPQANSVILNWILNEMCLKIHLKSGRSQYNRPKLVLKLAFKRGQSQNWLQFLVSRPGAESLPIALAVKQIASALRIDLIWIGLQASNM